MRAVPASPVRALTLLNQAGDTTIAWEEHQDEEMRAIIEQKMAEGVTFFIIKPRMGGWLPSKTVKLEAVDQAFEKRALSIPDADFRKFVSGGGHAISTPSAPVRGARRSKDAAEVAASESVGVKQLRGG